MKHITFHLDFISPYAYLAFEALPLALQGLSYSTEYRPLLFAGLLNHHGQRGPAELSGKRDWTYRQVRWQAQAAGIPLDLPAAHPFNPLPLLRIALACGEGGRVNRHVAETAFRHVWRGGEDAAGADRVVALQQALAPRRDPSSDEVKAELRANTDAAIAAGVFGVPTLCVDGKQFWGHDALPMLRAYLEGHPWFSSGDWEAAASLPSGATRAARG